MQHKEPQQQQQQRGSAHSSTCCNNACCLGPQKAPRQGLVHSSTYGGKACCLGPQTAPWQGLGHSSTYGSKARCLGPQTPPRQGSGHSSTSTSWPEELRTPPPCSPLTCTMEQLVILFNKVKDQGVVPKAWNRGRITLIHKKGSVSDIYNYRPITVLTSVSSLFTKVLNSRLTVVTEEHGLLGQIQHGFRKGRSGADASFVLNTVLWKSAARRKKVHLSFLDVAKALGWFL